LEPAAEPFFIGAERGIERMILPTTEFPHLLLDLHPLYRDRPWENWKTARGVVSAWRRIGQVLRRDAPSLVVGTGGYASAATLAYASAHGIPLVMQEQNSFPGITTRRLAPWARAIYLGYEEAREWLPERSRSRAVVTGNPIEAPPEPRPDRGEARRQWGFPERGGLVLLVYGGSQGARPINEAIAAWVASGLPSDLWIIWGTGQSNFESFRHLESERVRVRAYLSPMSQAYAACDLALTRSGAGALAELCAWGIPSILVPLPTAAADHQTANAHALAEAGAAVLLPQDQLEVARLARTVELLASRPDELSRLAASAMARGRPHAAEDIARRILNQADLKQLQA
jgi:UDP-N-acetylglucosamine--N-acetylmuramyl-(pentapeptide) pyrophosphoryl-undecaprenol N-acetylglucosamine transferase